VVASILLALAVDEWAQDRVHTDLASQSLGIFEREIRQNQARLADASPYHQGIRDLLAQMPPEGESPDLRNVMAGLSLPVLQNTAWETSLATGALTHMEFEVVSALSLTYSIQAGFESRSRMDRPRFTGPVHGTSQRGARVEEAYDYVAGLAREESELLSVYDQALELIRAYREGVDLAPGRYAAYPTDGTVVAGRASGTD
jgi:hypothetical protein